MNIFQTVPHYQNDFLVLRSFDTSDAPYLSDLYEENLTDRQARKTVLNFQKSYQEKDEIILGIFGAKDRLLKGVIEIYDVNDSEVSIGYTVIAKYRNQKYAKNAIYLLTKKLMQDYGIQCIHARTASDNVYSIRVLEHNGYERVGQDANEYMYEYRPKCLQPEKIEEKEKIIVLAGGCFWGMEKVFKVLDGVIDTTVGYVNGKTEQPTYEEVCRGETGYREAVKIRYQPSEVSLATILKAFFICIDPRQRNRQGNDFGAQYQTGIYYADSQDLEVIRPIYDAQKVLYDRFFVELEPLSSFYTAEEYHQDYLDKHPDGYCHITSFDLAEVRKLNQSPIQVTVRMEDWKERVLEITKNTSVEDLIAGIQEQLPTSVYAAIVNHRHVSFRNILHDRDVIELQGIKGFYGNSCYQSSLSLLYLKAIHDVMGMDVSVTIANSLSKGLFSIVHFGNVTDALAEQIQNRMHELVHQDLLLIEEQADRESALKIFAKTNEKKTVELLSSAPDLKDVYISALDDEKKLSFVHVFPSTKYIRHFEVRRYRNGLLLRFPHPNYPDQIPPYEEQKLLYDAFSEETQWEKLLKVSYVSDLNCVIERHEEKDLVMLSEALHEKKIAMIAEQISAAKKRIVLIAGPSSSGKTTFAKRLCIQLRVIGLNPLYLGTDDYFLDRSELVADENGKFDFEALSAVDLKLFSTQMNALLQGEKVDIPEFDFISGKKIYGKRITSIDHLQPIVIEGIHGLNPELTEGIDDEQKFKVYISPLTQINLDSHHRIPTTDARMLRRMVRDNRTRGSDAVKTISSWSSVRRGEEKYIFPYNSHADVFFNSQCVYELAVLKKYAVPLLEGIKAEQAEYAEAQRMLKFLSCFRSIDDDSVIANHSIIREFIGGSVIV